MYNRGTVNYHTGGSMHYKIEIIHYHWECGDGCCSDSWYFGEVVNSKGLIVFDNDHGDMSTRSQEDAIEGCINWYSHNKADGDTYEVIHYSRDEYANDEYEDDVLIYP